MKKAQDVEMEKIDRLITSDGFKKLLQYKDVVRPKLVLRTKKDKEIRIRKYDNLL